MESSHNQTYEPIDLIGYLKRFAKRLKKLWLLVLVLCLLGGGLNFFRARVSYYPMYQCKTFLSVTSGFSSDSVFAGDSYYDRNTAQVIANTFPQLISTEYMRDLIMARLGKDWINGSISASAVAETTMLELKVTSSSPQDAYDILMAVIDAYPQAAVYMVDDPIIELRQEPTVPTEPMNRFSPAGSLVKGALAGLLLGLALTAVYALLTPTVDSASGLKRVLNLPLLAAFPLVTRKKRRAEVRPLITSEDNPNLSEALRGLRTKVRKHLEETGGKVVLLTSTIPGEGKTTVSTNLALSLADEGHRVVLVDADLRNQTVAQLFRASQRNAGLMDCLKNPRMSVLECVKAIPGSDLEYISGASTSRHHYSLDAKNIRRVMDELCQHYDYVVVDTPPCSVVSDTALLSRYADCVLYVVKADYASQNQILDAVTGLHQREVTLTGCVFNGAPLRSTKHGYGYGYGYGYGKKYGYGEKKKRS